MEVLCWLTVLVLGCFSEPPNQAFPEESGNFGSQWLLAQFFIWEEPPQKLALPGYLAVLLLVPSGFALLRYSW